MLFRSKTRTWRASGIRAQLCNLRKRYQNTRQTVKSRGKSYTLTKIQRLPKGNRPNSRFGSSFILMIRRIRRLRAIGRNGQISIRAFSQRNNIRIIVSLCTRENPIDQVIVQRKRRFDQNIDRSSLIYLWNRSIEGTIHYYET